MDQKLTRQPELGARPFLGTYEGPLPPNHLENATQLLLYTAHALGHHSQRLV